MKHPIPVDQTREALLRKPNGMALFQVFLVDGAAPRTVTLPSPSPAGGSEHYRLVHSSPMRLEYERDDLLSVAG